MLVPPRQLDATRQLALIQRLAQMLLAARPLPQRLKDVLAALHTDQPYVAARFIVLHTGEQQGEPWSLEHPRNNYRWARARTAELLQPQPLRHEPLIQPLNSATYIGWPLRWQQRLYGALEIVLDEPEQSVELLPVLYALAPLIVTALAQPAASNGLAQPELSPDDQQWLGALAARFQAPLLLEPLLAQMLQCALERSGASRGTIYLTESNGHGLHLLAFELPQRAQPPALTAHNQTHALAKIALANGQAMIRQIGDETHFAAPLVHEDQLLGALALEGDTLSPQALLLVQRIAELAGSALLRAQFYQQIADARTHLQQVFDELPSGLALTASDGRLLRANPAWWRLWGIAPVDQPTVKLIPWDILPRILSRLPDPLAFSELFMSGSHDGREATIALHNPWQELRLLFMPVRDTLGLQAGFLLAIDDITRERESDRLKSEFVSVVSHELRTPLTSILGYTELLLARDFEAAERKEFIQTVYKEADHLSSLVEDLLNVSRLDAGKIKLERWVMALPKLVRELVAQLNTEIDVERHRVLLDVADALPPIYADRDRVRQILSNLLSNAIKYSPEGGEVVLHATPLRKAPAAAPPLPPEPAMLISVRDNGIGIPPHELNRIFERFYRVDNSNTRRIGGTGLGLAITRALVELHGGRIWAESTPGEGSTFYVTLPIATEMLRTRS